MELLGHGEVTDPGHLNTEDGRDLIAGIAALAVRQGRPVESVLVEILGEDADDPIARGLVNGQLLATLGGGFDEVFPSPDGPEPEPDLYPSIESVTVNPDIERLVRERYAATMAALLDGKMWDPENPKEGDIRPPTLEETIAILSSGLTPEQIEFAIGRMKKGQIILKPRTKFGRYAQMLDTGKKINGTGWTQQPTYVSPNRAAKFAAEDAQMQLTGDRIMDWDVGIGEGADLEAQSGILRDLLTKWEGELPKGVVSASPREQALLQKLGIMTGEPMDRTTWTPCRSDLDGRMIGEDGLVSGGYWSDLRPVFFERDPGNHCAGAGLRPVVMAKKA